MCRWPDDDPAGGFAGQANPDGLEDFAVANAENSIPRARRDDGDDRVGRGVCVRTCRDVAEHESVGGDDEDLLAVSGDVDEKSSDEKCCEHAGGQ